MGRWLRSSRPPPSSPPRQVHLDLEVADRGRGESCREEGGRAGDLERRLAAHVRRRVARPRADRRGMQASPAIASRRRKSCTAPETARPWFERAGVEGIVAVGRSAPRSGQITRLIRGAVRTTARSGATTATGGAPCTCPVGVQRRDARRGRDAPSTACRATRCCGRRSARRRTPRTRPIRPGSGERLREGAPEAGTGSPDSEMIRLLVHRRRPPPARAPPPLGR